MQGGIGPGPPPTASLGCVIQILIVDDSVTSQRLLRKAFSGEPDIEVVGTAATGVEAVELADRLRPTLITMDLRMPDMDGLAATEEIMARCPTRIVMVSAEANSPDQKVTFDALQAGALEVMPKLSLTAEPGLAGGAARESGFERYRQELLSTVRAMASVSVLRRRRGQSGVYLRPPLPPAPQPGPSALLSPAGGALASPKNLPAPLLAAAAPLGKRFRFVGIGASTGGPQVIAQLVAALPAKLGFPIAVVQHMSAGFTVGFAKWLQGESKLRVKLAEDGELPRSGTIYLAPDQLHLRLSPEFQLRLSAEPMDQSFRPSVDELFKSLALALGPAAIGMLLTGMGTDGARGLLAMRKAGAWTLAQEAVSCVVNGMPQAAANLGAVDNFVSPSMIASVLASASEAQERLLQSP